MKAITPLVGRILSDSEELGKTDELTELYLFYNRPRSDVIYTPVSQRLLPLDETWRHGVVVRAWPTKQLPEVIGTETLRALIREFSLFRYSGPVPKPWPKRMPAASRRCSGPKKIL